jgi:hypothetical protein
LWKQAVLETERGKVAVSAIQIGEEVVPKDADSTFHWVAVVELWWQ